MPIDQDARDAVRDEHDSSVFVEAGAGTGKTSAIVSRVVAMVASGWLELRQLAAITFTEAAAAELRDRIRDALERAATDVERDISERERCASALHQLDEAALTTLHGFAQRILAEHPLEAGLPPGFEVLDEIQARLGFEQRWSSFVDDLFDDDTLAPMLLRGLALRIGPEQLHDIARILDDHHDRLREVRVEAPSMPPLHADAILAALDELSDLRPACISSGDLLAAQIDRLLVVRDWLASTTDELDLIDVLNELPQKLSSKQGKKTSWSVDIDTVRAATVRVEEAVTSTIDAQRGVVLEALAARVIAFVHAAADARRAAGTLEFNDLLVLARDLLRDDVVLRSTVARRYRCILLDEFQDTDPLQIELALLLTTDDTDVSATAWADLTPRPGALVVVGDPKQSIYRFRRADLRVYHRAREDLGLRIESLVENFRSVPGILDFVNTVFAGLLDELPGVQAAHVDLHAHRSAEGAELPVSIFGGVADDGVGVVREREAADVASIVRSIKDDEWTVTDPASGVVRPARYEDIALLLPSRTVLPALEDALERADVPVRVESQSLVFSTAEVRDLLAALSAIDDPTDEVGVVAALRSPAFGCSDADLVEHVQHGGRWDYRREPPPSLPPDHPVVGALLSLRDFWEQRWWRSVSETVEALIRERRLLELALQRRRPRDHWRRIRYLLDQARAWDDAGGASLRTFVAWVHQQADERARVMESVAPDRDDDALRILTVHGAKGLEFPIVVLAGLNTQPVAFNPPIVWSAAGPELRVGTKVARTRTETDGYADAAADERQHEAAERLRLLYVAMTRARDHLVVSLHHKAKTECHAAKLVGRLAGTTTRTLTPSPPGRAASARRDAAPTSAEPEQRDAWIRARHESLRFAARPATVSATALAHAATAEPLDDEPPADRSPWRRGRAGTAIGRAVHAVLQTVDPATGDGLAPTARAQALAEEVPEAEAEIAALARSVLDAAVVRSAVGRRSWREVPVAATVDGKLLEGFVDLLVEAEDGLVVVDYKTDRVPGDADVDAALARYTPQGAAYALAIEQVLDRPVRRCVFVFAREGAPAVEREIADLPTAVAAAREALGAMASVP
jgi:ATP-dependent exoDNAse (exonuclease V) beta subunit